MHRKQLLYEKMTKRWLLDSTRVLCISNDFDFWRHLHNKSVYSFNYKFSLWKRKKMNFHF